MEGKERGVGVEGKERGVDGNGCRCGGEWRCACEIRGGFYGVEGVCL